MSIEDFDYLLKAIDKRIDKQKYGYTTFEEAAIHCGRIPLVLNVYHLHIILMAILMPITKYIDVIIVIHLIHCLVIQYLMDLKYHYINLYIELMTYNVPLELMCEILQISTNTAELWRKKIFSTVNNYQENLMLSDNVWIDETYIEDYEVEAISKGKHLR